ncbi:MAG TPA: hypothetical protein VF278_09705 [Pirellulales bacterium]
MTIDDARLVHSARLLAEYAIGVSAMSAVFSGSLSCYKPLAEGALADMLEMLSAVTAELSSRGIDATEIEMPQSMLADEPSSLAAAVERLPAFLAHVARALASLRVSDGTELTSISVRAQTFSLHLREASPTTEPDKGSERF